MAWPRSTVELIESQRALARQCTLMRDEDACWEPPAGRYTIGGCFICFPRGPTGPGAAGDRAWAAAALVRGRRVAASVVVEGEAGAPFEAGLLALREGALLEAAVRSLPASPDVLLVNASGRDHPRRAGLALQLGAVVGLPTVGVTHRPLLARGAWPADRRGATSPVTIDGDMVGAWLRTRAGARPLVVHPAWRTDVAAAVEVVARSCVRARTPEPLRAARRAARLARAGLTAGA